MFSVSGSKLFLVRIGGSALCCMALRMPVSRDETERRRAGGGVAGGVAGGGVAGVGVFGGGVGVVVVAIVVGAVQVVVRCRGLILTHRK